MAANRLQRFWWLPAKEAKYNLARYRTETGIPLPILMIFGGLIITVCSPMEADQAYYGKDSNQEPGRTAGSNPN